jgi:hypothetical protein
MNYGKLAEESLASYPRALIVRPRRPGCLDALEGNRGSVRVGLLAFACFDLADGGLDQSGALGVGEHGVDDAMRAGVELARAKIAVHAGEHIRRRIHVKRWSPFEGRIRFYRVAMAINPDVIARAVVLPRQAKSRCGVVGNRDLDIGKGADGQDTIFSITR